MGLLIIGIILFLVSFAVQFAAKKTGEGKGSAGAAWVLRLVGLGMVLFGSFSSTVVQIPAGYRGILLKFGAVQGVLSEGIHSIVPGVNDVILMEVRTQKEESQATAASRDLQTVTTSLALNFRVDPAQVGELYKKVGDGYKARIIDPAVQESIKVVTAQYTAEELIKNRAQVKAKVEEEIKKRLAAYNLLVEPSGLSITNFAFSEEFNRAIEAKQVAQQESEKQKYVLAQAELQRQTEVARAKGRSESAKLNAEALKVQGGNLVIAHEWIEKWDGKLPMVSSSGSGGMIIDLKDLMTGSTAAQTAKPSPTRPRP
ncbi:prohibitin family protein [bacterium]|nr:MAG: prohibitin family protein [bacterium]